MSCDKKLFLIIGLYLLAERDVAAVQVSKDTPAAVTGQPIVLLNNIRIPNIIDSNNAKAPAHNYLTLIKTYFYICYNFEKVKRRSKRTNSCQHIQHLDLFFHC